MFFMGAENMGNKGSKSKNRILEVSRTLFAKKGFSAVSMQDICTATELSRGGLYRYFGSTEEIFIAIIEEEQSNALSNYERAKALGVSPEIMLSYFVRSRINQLTETDSFENAISEFAANSEKGREILQKRAVTSVDITARMIEEGCDKGVFSCDNPKAAATQILWVLEGMSKHNALLPLTAEDISEQEKLLEKLLH